MTGLFNAWKINCQLQTAGYYDRSVFFKVWSMDELHLDPPEGVC